MFCPKCGQELKGEICGSCGYDRSWDALLHPTLYVGVPARTEGKAAVGDGETERQKTYEVALSLETIAATAEQLTAAAVLYEKLGRPGFRDSEERAKACRDRAREMGQKKRKKKEPGAIQLPEPGPAPTDGSSQPAEQTEGKKKKIIGSTAVVAMASIAVIAVIAVIALVLWKTSQTDFRYTYQLDSAGNAVITGCTGSGTVLSIPSVIDGHPVTGIGEDAFQNMTDLKSAEIPDGVTSIGRRAFYNCTGLASVTIPDSVTSIGILAFSCCSRLTNVKIPAGVTSIDTGAFSDCTSLTNVWISNGVTSIGNRAFYGCSNMKSVTIPESMTSIGDYAFDGCSGLTSVTISDSVTSIGTSSFRGCSSLTSVRISKGVSSIGDYAFSKCDTLSNVFYSGTQEEWNRISIGRGNVSLNGAAIHYNS